MKNETFITVAMSLVVAIVQRCRRERTESRWSV